MKYNEYNGFAMNPTLAEMFNNIFNGLVFKYGQVTVSDLYDYPLCLNGFDYIKEMSVKDYVHAKRIGWDRPLSMKKMFKVRETLLGDYIFELNLPKPKKLEA